MPLYEYQCEACDGRFEKIQKFSDPPPGACPKCGGTVRKLASAPAIQFKGSGWYITDYAKKSSTEASKAGASKDKSETTSTAASTDSAAKTDTTTTTSTDTKKTSD